MWVGEVVVRGVRHILWHSIAEQTCRVLGRTGEWPFTAEAAEIRELLSTFRLGCWEMIAQSGRVSLSQSRGKM